MNKSELNQIKKLIKNTKSVKRINLEKCSIHRDSSGYIVSDENGNYIFNADSLSSITLDMIELIKDVKIQTSYDSNINGWVVDSESEYPLWRTPVTNTEAFIKPVNEFKFWKVKYPTDITEDIFLSTFDSFSTALINLKYYLHTTNPDRIDFNVKQKEIAITEFSNLDGIDTEFAEEIVSGYGIDSYEAFLEVFDMIVSDIPDRYHDDLYEIVSSRASSEDEIRKSEELNDLRTNIVVDNI